MSKTSLKIKVCGLTQPAQIQDFISLKIDFLGFIFYEKSPRFVLESLALAEIKDVRHPGKVGVFVNETVVNIVDIAQKAGLNYVQLHGDEDQDFVKNLREELNDGTQIIKVLRIGNQTVSDLQLSIDAQSDSIDYFLFDTDSEVFGGTGKSFDHQILHNLKISKPYFLSGGISPGDAKYLKSFGVPDFNENRNMESFTRPFAIDINSKFETEPGIKDLEKIRRFVGECSREATD